MQLHLKIKLSVHLSCLISQQQMFIQSLASVIKHPVYSVTACSLLKTTVICTRNVHIQIYMDNYILYELMKTLWKQSKRKKKQNTHTHIRMRKMPQKKKCVTLLWSSHSGYIGNRYFCPNKRQCHSIILLCVLHIYTEKCNDEEMCDTEKGSPGCTHYISVRRFGLQHLCFLLVCSCCCV